MLAIAVAALGLRLYRLADAPVWWDEGWSVWLARMPLPEAAVRTAYDVHPPLYYAMLHLWLLVAGEGELAIRYPSLAAGVLGVALAYRLGREMGGRFAGIVAAAMLAVSPFNVVWSQQARMYAPLAALALLSTWLALRLWRGEGRAWHYVAAALAMLYTHSLSALFLALQNLMWLLYLRRARPGTWWRWPATQAALLIGLVPWLLVLLPRLTTWSVSEPIDLWRYSYYYWGALVRGTTVHVEAHTPLLVAAATCLGLAVLALVARARRPDAPAAWSLVLGAVLPLALMFLLSQPRGFYYSPRPEPRYLSPFAPWVYLLWAGGIAAIWRRQRPAGAALAVVSLALLAWSLPPLYAERRPQDDYPSLAATLRTYVGPDDLVLMHTDSEWPVFNYHYAGQWRGVPNAAGWSEEAFAGFLAPLLPGRQAMWLLLTIDAIRIDPGMALEAGLARWCETGVCHRDEWRFGERRLVRYAPEAPLPQPSLAAARPLAGPGTVRGAWWAHRHPAVGEEWRLYAWWQGGEPPAVEIEGPDGSAQPLTVRLEPAAGAGPWRAEFRFLPPEPGAYAVRLRQGGGDRLLARLSVSAAEARPLAAEARERQSLALAFEQGVHLDGFALSRSSVAPGEEVCVTLYWRRGDTVPAPYAVFVHLLGHTYNAGQGNFLWGQHDGQPADGRRPLPSWRPGEAIEDRHCFAVDSAAPAGAYLIEVGLYDRTSGARLPLVGGGDHAILADLTVAPP